MSHFKEIKKGILQFKQYQMDAFFRIDDAILASAKAAYIASKIKNEDLHKLEKFQPTMNKQQFLIQNHEFNFLNKLQVEALFYWNKALKTIKKI